MTFRYARHTSNLEAIEAFYTKIIGLEVIGGFENHSNYNGLFLGLKDTPWHLEFTTSNDTPKHTFDEDDALVFYFDNQTEIDTRVALAKSLNYKEETPVNPYWQTHGKMLLDPDGFRVILAVSS